MFNIIDIISMDYNKHLNILSIIFPNYEKNVQFNNYDQMIHFKTLIRLIKEEMDKISQAKLIFTSYNKPYLTNIQVDTIFKQKVVEVEKNKKGKYSSF